MFEAQDTHDLNRPPPAKDIMRASDFQVSFDRFNEAMRRATGDMEAFTAAGVAYEARYGRCSVCGYVFCCHEAPRTFDSCKRAVV